MGRLLASYSRPLLLAVSMSVSAGGLAALPFVTWLPGLYAIMVVTGLGLGLCQPLTVSWVAGQVPPEIRGMAMSVRLAGNRLGQVVVPLGVGILAGAAGLASAFDPPRPHCWPRGAGSSPAIRPRALREDRPVRPAG